ncbi:MAG: hypothetical protein ACLFU6_01190 [Candidatus Hydrogenedentota bacterium]
MSVSFTSSGMGARKYEGNYYEVKYKFLLTDRSGELKRIYGFRQLDYTDGLVNGIVAGHEFFNTSDGLEFPGAFFPLYTRRPFRSM